MPIDRNHPPGLGSDSPDTVAEREFAKRTVGQDTNRKPHEVPPNADAGPEHPQVNQPEKKSGKEMDHTFRSGAGHAQSPVWTEK